MKKGNVRIIIGCVLIFLQILSAVGNAKTGINIKLSFDNVSVFFYDLIFLLSYLMIGIIGATLLIWGICVYNKKPKSTNKKENILIVNQQEPTIEEQLPSNHDEKQHNRRFCSLCGGEINPTTKKCSQCGKQYFKGIKLNKSTITILVLVLLLLVSVVVNIVQYSEHSYLLTDYAQSEFRVSNLEKEKEKQQGWLDLYETSVVVLMKGSKHYHKASCYLLHGETIRLAWKSAAEDLDNTPCPTCHK